MTAPLRQADLAPAQAWGFRASQDQLYARLLLKQWRRQAPLGARKRRLLAYLIERIRRRGERTGSWG